MNTGANPKNITSIHDEYDDALKGFVNYAGYVDSINGVPSALNVLGDLKLLNITGSQAFNYPVGDTLRVRVSDADRNVSTTAADTVTVSVSSAKETTAETIVLTETGVNTGVFSASVLFDATGAVASDGSLQVDGGDMITVNYTDPADDFGNAQILTATSFYGMTEVTSGFILSNTTWTKANSPYFLTGDVIVPDSVTLTIEPGVNVRFKAKSDDMSSGEDQNRIEIRVSGSLKANGNATDSVYFISNAQNPSAGDWYGIVSYNATSTQQPSSYTSNWDKVGAVDISYARVAHYIKGVSARDYASASRNGINYGWDNSLSPDSIKIHNSVFQAGGDAYFCSDYWSFRPLEFVNNRVHNAGLYSYGKSSYKKVENNNFKSNYYSGGSGMNPFRIHVSGDQRGSNTPHCMLLNFKNNNIDFGYVEINASSEVGSVAQKSATIDISGNTIHRNNNAKIYVRYYNYGLSLDSTNIKVSNNTIVGVNVSGQGLELYSNQQGARWEIKNNNLRSLNRGLYLSSDQSSEWLVENNTIDSTYYNGIYKSNGSAKIIGNTIEHAGRYSWNGTDMNGVYLTASANYPGTDTLKNNTIRYNGSWDSPNNASNNIGIGGVTIDGNVTAVINANNIYENNGHDVINLVSKSVAAIQDAKYNYWGPTTTAEIANGANPKNISAIHDEYDDALKGFVNYGQNYLGIITKDLLPDSLFYGGDSLLVATSNGTIGDWSNGVTNANKIELNGYEGQIKVTFDFFGDTIQDSSYVMNLDTLYVSKIQADSLVGPIPGGNGSAGNMFNVINTSGVPLEITGFSQGPASGNSSASNVTIQVYYSPGDYTTQPTSSWVAAGSAVTNLTANAATGYVPVSVTIPAGATYGFYVGRTSGSVQYTNGTGTAGVSTWFSNSALTVTEGVGGSYPNPTYSPRCWNGTVHYGDPNGIKINARPEAMFAEIQDAINASDTSDVILVGPGVFAPFKIDDTSLINGNGFNIFSGLTIQGLDSLNRPVITGYDSVRSAEVLGTGILLKYLSFRNGYASSSQYNIQRGGLLYAWGNTGDRITVESCDFKDGYAPQGGDYYAGGGGLTFINCEFLRNDKQKNRMIHVDNGMWANFYNTLFDVNGYSNVLSTGFTHRIYNSTIVNLSGKLYQQPPTGHEFDFVNNIVVEKVGASISLDPDTAGWGGEIHIRNSRLPVIPAALIYSPTASISAVSCDTLPVYFVDSANGDYRLSLLDDHHNIGDLNETYYTDLYGVNRPDVNGKVDLGAYESDASLCDFKQARVSIIQTITAGNSISNVTLDFPGNYTSVLWSTGDTAQSISPYSNKGNWNSRMCYWVSATDADGCSLKDTIYLETAQITFRVDMRNQPIDSSKGVHLAGSWNSWQPNTFSMTDPDGDLIYERTERLIIGDSIEYKFINGNSWNDPQDKMTSNCSSTYNSATASSYGNRMYIVSTNDTLTAFHLSSCSEASPVDALTDLQSPKCSGATIDLVAGNDVSNVVWNTGDTTNTLTVSAPGTYWFTAIYPDGVVVLDSTVVPADYSRADTSVIVNGSLTFCSDQSLVLVAAAGQSYMWSTGDTSQSITVDQAGSYYAVVTSVNGCIDTTASYTTTLFPDADTAVTASGSLDFCNGGSATLTAALGHNYIWNTGETTQSITVNQSGSYQALVTTNAGCTDTTATYTTTVFADPDTSVTASGSLDFCNGGSVTLTAAAGQSYSWSNGSTTQSITVSLAGSYSATVTTVNGCVDTTATYTTTVFADADTSVTASGSLDFCNGGSVTLTAASGQTYSWSNGATTQSITVSQAGSYSATVTTVNGCVDTTAIYTTTVFADADTSVTASGPLSFCNGGSVILTAAVGQTYLWSNGATTQSITVSQTGSYSATVTTSNGCIATTGVYATSVFAAADTTLTTSGPLSFCNGGSVTLTAAAGQTYLWSNGSTIQSITVSQAGSYSATVTTADGCVGTTATLVTSSFIGADTSVTSSGSLSFCNGGSVTFTAVSGQNYLWNTGDTTQSITASTSGNYSATVTTNDGCVGSTMPKFVNVFADADTSISVSQTLFCASDSATLSADINQVYSWNTGETTQSIVVNTTGDYYLTTTTSDGCVGVSDTVSITVVPDIVMPQIVSNGLGWVTSGATSSFTVVADSNYSYQWGVSQGAFILNGQGTDSIDVYWGPADSNLTIWLIVSNGVCSDSTGINITISGVGIDTDNMGSMQLYPNPNDGRFAVRMSEENIGSTYRVVDLIGRSIAEGEITSAQQSFDLSDKPKGTYRIQIINSKGFETLSVVIQ